MKIYFASPDEIKHFEIMDNFLFSYYDLADTGRKFQYRRIVWAYLTKGEFDENKKRSNVRDIKKSTAGID